MVSLHKHSFTIHNLLEFFVWLLCWFIYKIYIIYFIRIYY